MATIILNQNETSTIANDGDIVRGRQAGAEAIRIESGVTDIETNAELERIDLPAVNASDLTFQVTNNGLTIGDGSNTIVTVPSLNQNLNLRLSDGNVTLSQTGAQEFTLTNPTEESDTQTIGTDAASIEVGLGEETPDDTPAQAGDIQGTDGNDLISPDAENEDFVTSDADESINALGGNDTIDGGGGADTVLAGSGNDVLVGDPDDAVLDGEEGFDTLQIGEVSNSSFGSEEQDISLETVSNVQLIDTTNSQGGNIFDLSDALVDSITGGENTLGVLENNLALLVGNQADEIDLGDITPPSGTFQPGDEAPITIQVVFAGDASTESNNLTINNAGGARVRELNFGDTSVVGENSFEVKPGPSYYLGTDSADTVTAPFSNLDVDDNNIGNDTIAAADGEDTLSLTGNVKGDLPLAPFAFFSGFETLDLSGDNTTVTNNLIINNQFLSQLTRGESQVNQADDLTVQGSGLTIDTQDVGQDDDVSVEGGDFILADNRTQSSLEGNIISISDNGAGVITGGNGNDTINGGTAGDYIDLRPKEGNTSSGDNVVTGGNGADTVAAGNSEDSLEGGAGNDRFLFQLDSRTSGVSRLDTNDTVAGGPGEQDTIALVANTLIRGTSETQNVTGIEVIELNADGADDNEQFFPLIDLLDNDTDIIGPDSEPDGSPDAVNNEITLIDSVVESADGGLTIDASNNTEDQRGSTPGEIKGFFSLSDPQDVLGTINPSPTFNPPDSPADSVDNNVVDLTELSADKGITLEGGNAHEKVVFSDTSFNGKHELDGGNGGVDPTVRQVGLPTFNANTPVTPSFNLPPASAAPSTPPTANANRVALADAISNFDTLDFRADGSNTFSSNITDFNNIGGFEEIQLSNEVDGANSTFDIELSDEIVRQLTENVGADTTTTGQNTNLHLSLDPIDSFFDNTVAGATNNVNQDIGQNSNINLVTEALTDSLNTLTILDPNGLSLQGTPGTVTVSNNSRVNIQIADIITSSDISEARGRIISQSYQSPQNVTVNVGHNLLGIGDTNQTDFDSEGVRAKLDFGAGPTPQPGSVSGVNISTGDGDFVIWTTNNNDTITAGNGNDRLIAGAGNDIFNRLGGDEGNDTIVAGSGSDTLQYANFNLDGTSGIEVDLDGGSATGVDVIQEDANESSIENIIGSQVGDGDDELGEDTLTGSDEGNRINGLSGSDTISGLEGADLLIGNTGNDTIEGGSGPDTIDGGNGTDTVSYASSQAGVTVDLFVDANGDGAIDQLDLDGDGNFDRVDFDGDGDQEALTPASPANPDVFTIDLDEGPAFNTVENIIGSAFNDVLSGDPGENNVEGGAGADNINGNAGDDELIGGGDNDTIEGGAGADTIDGGSGTDTASYTNAGAGVDVSLALEEDTPQDDPDTVADGDVLINVENLLGSAQGDTLTGNDGNNQLNGTGGNDTLVGDDPDTDAGGADTLIGGAGTDTLTGGAGSDIFRFNDPAEGGLEEQITNFKPVNEGDIIQLNDDNFATGGAQPGTTLFNAGENGNINTGLVTGGGLEGFIEGGGSSLNLGSNLPAYIYGSQSGILAFDADGDGGAQAEAIARFNTPTGIEADQNQTFNEALSEGIFSSIEFTDVV